MTAPRDPDVLIAAFLDEGQTDLPDRTFDAVRRDIHQTRQRVVIGPWREPDMSMLARVAIAAVAVLAVGLAWVNFGPGQPGLGAQPTPTTSPTPTPQALPVGEQVRSLQSGTYVTQGPFPVRVTFTAPDGWEGHLGSQYFAIVNTVNGSVQVIFSSFLKVVADPCHFDQGFVQVESSVDDLATALTRMPGVTATVPTDVTLSGYAGKQLTVTAPTSFAGCSLSPDGYVLWQLPPGGNYIVDAGAVSRLWILDVDGYRLVITHVTLGETAQERADAQAILDSIRIAPAN